MMQQVFRWTIYFSGHMLLIIEWNLAVLIKCKAC